MPTGWPRHPEGLLFGGDYNPEQWPEDVWAEDVRLMQRAGVNIVSVGIFSWALLEPEEGRYSWEWLDRVIDLLHGGGISVDLATATATPPPWLSHRYPETLPVTEDGVRLSPGARQAYCPSSPTWRRLAARMAGAMAERYADHPALALWHVGNEYGCHVPRCYCDVSAAAFRVWLRERYGDLDALNNAWGTAFWGQRYGDWDEVLPPRRAPTFRNPAQQVDFRRFSSEELLACYRNERDALRAFSPDVPATTNFMLARFAHVDAFRWAGELDLVSNDHYLATRDPEPFLDLALSADLSRGVAGGAPWLLMEHSTGAVSWQPPNVVKRAGQLRRNSLGHVARGSDGALFFQWRASRAGSERWMSGMVPHAGADSRIFREVEELGATLGRLGEVAGSRVHAEAAILFDWEAWWALELDALPAELRYLPAVAQTHAALLRAGVTVDLVHPDSDLAAYRLLLVPSLYLVSDAAAEALARRVEAGATAVVSFFSGIVDEHDRVRLGGYPGAFRALLGVRADEFAPLEPGAALGLSSGGHGTLWSESLEVAADVEVQATYLDDDLAGRPAVTRRAAGAGAAWYLSTRLDDASLGSLLRRVCEEAGVRGVVDDPPHGLEAVRRRHDDGRSYLFLLNHGDVTCTVAADGHDLVADRPVEGAVRVEAGGVAVVREVTA